MNLYRWIIAGLWLLFILYWVMTAAGVKRNTNKHPWRWEIGLRLVMIVLIVALLKSRSLRQILAHTQRHVNHSSVLGWLGVVLCLCGIGLAINARRHLGPNWGLPMSRKEQPELITSGPYRLIRHPIYSGLILGMLGSAIAVNILWLLLLVLVGTYFIFSARREETVMLQQFPQQYSAYKMRTGMLTPCPLRRHP